MKKERLPEVQFLIDELNLTPHVEGGAFRETYRSHHQFHPEGYSGPCAYSTAIYFLLEFGEFSAFHRIKSDEMWHHYLGGTLHIYEINVHGNLIHHKLGKQFEKGEQLQVWIPGGSWFASRVEQSGEFVLSGCTVAPGFDFRDFELADRKEFAEQFPEYRDLIKEMTR
ncbi:MAG: cupin domain-containing protein [Bacteroidota bacterium]|nr:cupin domain-containing protein [Bacteroidota bacterium]MDX5429850.1 cupin domain-containing protein [Bacteroidota bacterium]MDX5468629.1 cupin domain-containing protein [Bacteroidota bacterium]